MNKLPPTKDKKTEVMNGSATAMLGEIKVEIVAIEVPYVTATTTSYIDSEMCKRCDLGVLTREQARKLRAIRRGYEYSGKRLLNGNEVKSLADAMKMLLDSIDI